MVKDRAHEIGVHFATLYRWLTTYERDPDLSSLLPVKAYRLPITKRIDPAVKAIVMTAIRQVYLKENGASMRALNQEIKEKCETAQLPAPSRYTVRRRSLEVSLYNRTKVREGDNAALKFDTVKGSLLGAEYPWAVVQMDHFLLNIEVVDDDGLPVGRPWVTLAIETFSRMILGYSLGFEKPSLVLLAGSNAGFATINRLISRAFEQPEECIGLNDLHDDHSDVLILTGGREANSETCSRLDNRTRRSSG